MVPQRTWAKYAKATKTITSPLKACTLLPTEWAVTVPAKWPAKLPYVLFKRSTPIPKFAFRHLVYWPTQFRLLTPRSSWKRCTILQRLVWEPHSLVLPSLMRPTTKSLLLMSVTAAPTCGATMNSDKSPKIIRMFRPSLIVEPLPVPKLVCTFNVTLFCAPWALNRGLILIPSP